MITGGLLFGSTISDLWFWFMLMLEERYNEKEQKIIN